MTREKVIFKIMRVLTKITKNCRTYNLRCDKYSRGCEKYKYDLVFACGGGGGGCYAIKHIPQRKTYTPPKVNGFLFMFWVGGCGVLGLGVRIRMKGDFTTINPFSRFFIIWLGVAPKFSVFFCESRPEGCWALTSPTACGPKLAKKQWKNGINPSPKNKKARKWIYRRKIAFHSDPNP